MSVVSFYDGRVYKKRDGKRRPTKLSVEEIKKQHPDIYERYIKIDNLLKNNKYSNKDFEPELVKLNFEGYEIKKEENKDGKEKYTIRFDAHSKHIFFSFVVNLA